MRAIIVPCAAICLCSAALSQTTPTFRHSEADVLAAESLRHSAVSVAYSPRALARAARLVALTQYAHSLTPEEPLTNRLLIDIYETQNRVAQAATAADAYLISRPNDHAVGQNWLRLNLSTRQNADARIDFLKSVMARKDLPGAIKSRAAAAWAGILARQGQENQARATYARALQFDAHNPAALNGQFSLIKQPKTSDRTALMLALLECNPRDLDIAAKLAVQLDSLGLYGESLALFEYCTAISKLFGDAPSHEFIVEHFNAMLDAGKAREAIEEYQQAAKRYSMSVDLQVLMIEAYRTVGDLAKADAIIQKMLEAYKRREAAAKTSPAAASEFAWFYLVTLNQPAQAMKFARQAEKGDPNNAFVQRILGIAELKNDQAAAGVSRLSKLAKDDIYAAAYLAEHYFAVKDTAAAKRTLLAGAGISRSGPAWRQLAKLAAENKITVPPPPGSEKLKKDFDAFGKTYLAMGRSPEKFLSVTLRPTAEQFAPGEPIEVEAVLTNTSKVPIPLGEWGLFQPTLSLKVTTPGGKETTFTDLPLLVWAAPRTLAGGQSIKRRIRLDVGAMAAYFMHRPLEELTLTVTGMIDPLQKGEKLFSSLPSVKPKAATIRRVELVKAFGPAPADPAKACQRAMGVIVYYIKRGKLAERMRTARQIASLLSAARDAELGKAKLPEAFARQAKKPVLLALLKAALEDPAPCVRAEVISALEHTRLDSNILWLVRKAADDPSPLVRFRLAEMLGTSDIRGRRDILESLAKDKDERVRKMAAVLQKK